jgi:sialate O-acetylesterase
MALALPRTGMAVTIDIGNPKDVHPRNKQDVGRRLALQARAKVYGEDVVCSGPVLERAVVRGREIQLRFRHAESGLVARGDRLTGFEIASADGPFVPAEARIVQAEVGGGGRAFIRVRSPEIESPAHVRYAWADSPEANLYNREGLPAVPFRTDRRPGITEKNL